MEDCDYFRPAEIEATGVMCGVIWGLFTVVWLGFTACSTRSASVGMELFIAFIAIVCSGAGFAQAFIPWECDFADDPAMVPIVLVITLSRGMFILLQLFISRGYGLTRYQLTLTEIVLFIVCSVVIMIALIIPFLSLIYLIIYILFVVYGCRTYSLLGQQNPVFGAARNSAILKKQQIFLSMMLLVVFAVILSVSIGVAQITSGYDSVYRYLYVVLLGIVQILYVAELLLLQVERSNPDFNFPLVSVDEIYLIRQSFVVPQLQNQIYYPSQPQYFPSDPSYGYNQPYGQPAYNPQPGYYPDPYRQ